MHINELEATALIIGLKIWKHKCINRNILVYCDNKVTVDIVNTGKATNHYAQKCLREICWITSQVNAVVKVVYLTTKANRKSDLLSRWHLNSRFKQMFLEKNREWDLKEQTVQDVLFEFEHNW